MDIIDRILKRKSKSLSQYEESKEAFERVIGTPTIEIKIELPKGCEKYKKEFCELEKDEKFINEIKVNTENVVIKYLKEKNIDMILAPDKGALERAKKASEIIECDVDYMEKTRINGSTIKIKPKKLNAKNKNVDIIDDIISTGGTMAKSIQQLKKHGAKNVFVACTHGLFAGDAVKKLTNAGCNEIISTYTIQGDFSKVKISPCISPFF